MQTNCKNCGGDLPDGQAFCTACGMRRDEVPATIAASHCTACGAELESGLRFCTRCGAPVAGSDQRQPSTASQPASHWTAVSQSPDSSAAAYFPPPPMIQLGPLGTTAPVKKKGNLVFKLAIAVVAILLLGGMAVAGGIAYLGYVAKKRITAAKQAYQKDDYEGVLAAAEGKDSSSPPSGAGLAAKTGDAKPEKKDLLGGLISAVSGGDTKPEPLPEWKLAPADMVASPASAHSTTSIARDDSCGNGSHTRRFRVSLRH